MQAETVSIRIERPWQTLYEAVWHPSVFPLWASGLSDADLHEEDGRWFAQGPGGPVSIRFSDHNAFGVMDHWVDTGTGSEIYIPLRIVANGEGAEVTLTLFRQPDMDDARFADDLAWVRRDLAGLKALAERL